MNTGHGGRRVALLLCIVCSCGIVVPNVLAVSTITKTDGAVLKVSAVRWIESANAFSIVLASGATEQLQKGLVDKIEMDKPQKLVLAENQIRGKQYDAALLSLENVLLEYQKLGWDVEAACRIAEICLNKKNDPKRAAMALEKAMSGVPKSEISAEMQLLYWSSLLAQGAGSAATLKKELDDAIAGGSRELAAAAYVARGSLNAANKQREAALLDYLRVVILFENVKAVQPEALFKAAKLLDEMQDRMGRGDLLRRKLLDQYPDSSYADDARKKMG